MDRHPLFLLLLSAFVASSLAIHAVPTSNTSYVIVTSDVLVPGSELLIDLNLLDLVRSDPTEEDNKTPDDECLLDLSVSADDHLWHRSVWKLELDKTPKSFSKTLRILVSPDGWSLGDKTVLNIESKSCFKFSRSVEVPTAWKELLVSLRTDKLKYRPGDLVLIESLVLTEELLPYWKPVNLSIHNSRDIVVIKWLNVIAENGLIRKEYLLPLLAQSDELVLTFESHNQVINRSFHVEQPAGPYDHESFLVDVRSPKYHTLHSGDESKSPSLELSVLASHQSGAPLKGNVELQFSLVNSTKSGSLPRAGLDAGLKVFSLKPDEIKNILGLKTEETLVGHQVRVQVTVEEERPKPGQEKEKEEDDEIKDREKNESDRRTKSTFPVITEVLFNFVDQSHVLFFSEFTPQFFKPGLSYVGQVLLIPVEKMLPASSEEKEVSIKVNHYTSNSESPGEEKITLKLKPNSLGEFSLRVPKETIKLELEAEFEDKESGKVVRAHVSEILPFVTKNEEGHLVQVLAELKPPKIVVGETLKAKVETTFPTDKVLYQVVGQSGLVLSGKLLAPYPSTIHDLSVLLPQNVSHLLSNSRLVVEVVSPTNEILSDSLRIVVVQKRELSLDVSVKPEVAEPGDVVELLVRAEPFTSVYLMSFNDLLAFDPKEQEARKQMAHEKMLRYLRNLNTTVFSRTIDGLGEMLSTLPSLSPDSQRLHNESESLLLTDGLLFIDPSRQWPIPPFTNGTLDDLEPSSLNYVEEFDANLWKLNVTVGPSGEEKLFLVLPVEARLYTLAAFGLRPGKGLVVIDEPLQLMSTSKILTALKHPESVVCGEEVVLEVHLFNNQENEAKVQVTVGKSHGWPEDNDNKRRHSEVVLKPRQLIVAQFPVKTPATAQEPLEFEVEVVSEDVHHKLNSSVELKYQGYEVVPSESLLLDNFNGEQVLVVDVPKNITNPIEKSERVHVKIYGHPLGPAIEHVCQHLNQSSVLEERTKLDFVLAINVLEHIANNSLFDNSVLVDYDETKQPINVSLKTTAERDECVRALQTTLQRMLNKNKNGSISFYPNITGDIWLTSVMLDSIVLLRNVVSWDKNEVVKTVTWLANQQHDEGFFVQNYVFLLGAFRSYVPLTLKVVASLLEVSNALHLPKETNELVEFVTRKAIEFADIVYWWGYANEDSYISNLAVYVYTLAKREDVFTFMEKRDQLVVQGGDGSKYWIVGKENVSTCPLSIEATSYAILTSLAMYDLDSARPYVNFVLSAMEPNGMFGSSQSTHVALKALSQYFRMSNEYHKHEHVNIDVNITLSNQRQLSTKVLSPLFVGSLYFDHSNLSLSSPLRVESSGKGFLLVQNVPEFNEAFPASTTTSIHLRVEVKQKDPEHLTLTVCESDNWGKGLDSFLVGEVHVLSGYEQEFQQRSHNSDPQVLKQRDEVYLIFHKDISAHCVNLNLTKRYQVGNIQPGFVKVYWNTEPGKSVYIRYEEKLN